MEGLPRKILVLCRFDGNFVTTCGMAWYTFEFPSPDSTFLVWPHAHRSAEKSIFPVHNSATPPEKCLSAELYTTINSRGGDFNLAVNLFLCHRHHHIPRQSWRDVQVFPILGESYHACSTTIWSLMRPPSIHCNLKPLHLLGISRSYSKLYVTASSRPYTSLLSSRAKSNLQFVRAR